MQIEVTCPSCRHVSQIAASFVGLKRPCKQCGRAFTIEAPPRAAPLPKKNTRLFDASCPVCGAAERTPVMMAGAPKTCSKCQHTFTVQLPEAVRSAQEAERAAAAYEAGLANDRREAGCAHCFRVYWLAAGPATTVRCQYCGAPTSRDAALELGPQLEALKARVTLGLLAGRSFELLSAEVPRDLRSAFTFILKTRVPELPALRSDALEARNRGRPITLGAPTFCERCIQTTTVEPYRLDWSRVLSEERSLHAATALTLFAGQIVTQKRQEIQQLSEVAYLCRRCEQAPSPPGPNYTLTRKQLLPPI